MRWHLDIKSKEWQNGYVAGLCFISDIFESRSNALFKRGLRRKDVWMIVAIIDAAIRARNRLAEVGPRNMDLVLKKDGSAEFIERTKANES